MNPAVLSGTEPSIVHSLSRTNKYREPASSAVPVGKRSPVYSRTNSPSAIRYTAKSPSPTPGMDERIAKRESAVSRIENEYSKKKAGHTFAQIFAAGIMSGMAKREGVSLEPYKGVRDFYPEDQFVLRYIFEHMERVCELFGYEEYGASILEHAELYRAKTSEEIVSEQTYQFTDRGGREVVLRPEMTPTLARMVAARSRDIPFPARWNTIANVFRYERPQRGRLREHWQLNADILGVEGGGADAEIIAVAHNIMDR